MEEHRVSSITSQSFLAPQYNGSDNINSYSIVSFICSIAIALSLAEIASIYPTAGGQYHWVAALAPPRQKIIASWLTGWISVGGQIVLTASAAFVAGLQFQSLITLSHPNSYMPERWQGMLFYWFTLLYSAAVNIWGSKVLPHTNLASGTLLTGLEDSDSA